MLGDYIPVYYPGLNAWSFPSWEVVKYEDYVPEPRELELYNGSVVRGIPLLHFGTWGVMGVDVTKLIQKLAKNPKLAEGYYKSRKTAADVAKFFSELRKRYPKIVSVRRFGGGCSKRAKALRVPAACIVKYVQEGGAK